MDTPRDGLVEPEGVNAGSARSATEDSERRAEDARSGGEPERAREQADPRADPILDAPFAPRDPDAPSLEQGIEEGAR